MPYRCPYCGEASKALYSLKCHFSRSHRDLEGAWLNSNSCPACGKRVRGAQGLIMHAFWRGLAGFEDHAFLYYFLKDGRQSIGRGTKREAVRGLVARALFYVDDLIDVSVKGDAGGEEG